MRRRGFMSCAAVLVCAGSAAAAGVAQADDTDTFSFIPPTKENPTPSQNSRVPAGVTGATVELFGAQGQGLGAQVTSKITVKPGETLRIFVGGQGNGGGVGGYNGGGTGGLLGGGGASDVRRGPAFGLGDRLVVGGGGGGLGGQSQFGGAPGPGGASDADGIAGQGNGAGGGGGKSASNGGAGGTASVAGPYTGPAGGPGALGTGGSSTNVFGGGGGGGGLRGGGAGGSSAGGFVGTAQVAVGGGGGGGGSSLGTTIVQGKRTGNGAVTITYAAPGAGGGGGTGNGNGGPGAPRVSSFAFSRSTFRAASSGGSTSRRKPIGSGVSFRLSEAATVKFTVQRKASGRKVSGKCKTPKRRYRRKPKCTRWLSVAGSFSVAGNPGANEFTFRGRIGGGKLRAASYRLSAVAKDKSGKKSGTSRKGFRIVR